VANFCSQCGAHLSGPFCSNCGAHTDLPATTPAPVEPAVETSDLEHIQSLVHRAFLWFVWPFVIGRVLDLTAIFLMQPDRANAVMAIGYVIGASFNVGIAYWLLYLAGKGSPLARRAYCVIWGAWGAITFVLSVIGIAAQPSFALAIDLVGVLVMVGGIYQSIRILRRIKPVVRRVRAEGGVTTVSMRTEMPSFIATVLLLCLTVLQVGRDLFHPQ
jgi:hypothetical protein